MAKSETISLLNEHYEILWSIVNSPDSELSDFERLEINGKLESLMAKTGEYWAARKAGDGVKLSKDAHDLAAQAGAAAKAGNMPAATQAFDKMGATCNTCHELHLEKR